MLEPSLKLLAAGLLVLYAYAAIQAIGWLLSPRKEADQADPYDPPPFV